MAKATNSYNELTRSFKRMFDNMPLDASTVFATDSAATAYAEGRDKTKGVAYLGQIISVLNGGDNNDELKIYKVVRGNNGDNLPYALEEVGKTSISEDVIINGVTYPAGTEIVEVIYAIEQALSDADGVIKEDITYTDGEGIEHVAIASGTSFSDAFEAIGSLYELISNLGSGIVSNITVSDGTHSSNIVDQETGNALLTVVGDDDISVTMSGGTLTIELLGISNPEEIVLP